MNWSAVLNLVVSGLVAGAIGYAAVDASGGSTHDAVFSGLSALLIALGQHLREPPKVAEPPK